MERYPIETLPFPVRPNDLVHFVVDLESGPAIETCLVSDVEVNDEKRLIVYIDGDDYEVGIEDRCFLTLEDALRFIDDEDSFTLSYGTTDLWPDDVPFRPGDICYTADDDPYEFHNVFETNVYSIRFTETGEIFVMDDMSCESCIVGAHLDPCYLTYEEAHAWAYEHLKAKRRR